MIISQLQISEYYQDEHGNVIQLENIGEDFVSALDTETGMHIIYTIEDTIKWTYSKA